MNPTIRSLGVEDDVEVERLYEQSAAHLRALGEDADFLFNADIYRRDGFGDDPAFAGIGAELDGRLVGYLLYTFAYDTDRAMRYLFVLDLLVDQNLRLQGIGRALMAEAASLCRSAGGSELFWTVYAKNEPAARFYRRLGGEEIDNLRFMRLGV